MNKLIFNEKLYIEQLLQRHDKDKVDIHLFQLMQLISIYLYQEFGFDDTDRLAKAINSEIEMFNFDGYYYEKYYRTINNIAKSTVKYDLKLKEAYAIPIYKSEYDMIKSCGDKKCQKLLFTLYVMARWNNDTSGWTSNKCKIIHFKKSANLNCTNKELIMIFHILISNGYIKITKKVGKFCYQMQHFNTDKNDAVVMQLTSFDNLGNQFIASQGNTHITCCSCGRLVKKTNNKMKYCSKCAEKIIKEKDKEYKRNKRKD